MASGCRRRRTLLERVLVVVGILTCVVIATSARSLAVDDIGKSRGRQGNDSKAYDICHLPACTAAAGSVIKKMDLTVEPCDDFYSYACGSYLRTTNIPDDKGYVGSLEDIEDLVQQQLRSILEEPESSSDNRPVKLAKNIYKACMNETRLKARGLKPVKKILQELHGWPVVEGDAWKPVDWKSYVYQLRNIGLDTNFLISFGVGPDLKKSSRRKIYLEVASLGRYREFLVKGIDDPVVKAYYQSMVDHAVIFGSDKERAILELKQALEFEMSLANMSPPKEDRRDHNVLYNPMTISELQTKFPSIPCLEYINNLLPQQVRVDNEDVVVVTVPNYISKLEDLLKNTNKRVIANYCMWRVVKNLAGYILTQEEQDRALRYSRMMTGQRQENPRWNTCTKLISKGASLVMGSLYVTKFFDKTSKKAVTEMVIDIQHTFQEMLKQLDWMDESTRERALSKAKAMSLHIAYPEELLDADKLDKFYEKLTVNKELFFETILNITRFETDYSFGLLHTAVNKTDWITHGNAAEVNAVYQPLENSIFITAAIMQGSIFGSDRPKYINYGGIGSVIGHEIVHGFDDRGRLFDDGGNLVDWWEKETGDMFVTKAKCIINQYSNYTEKSTGTTLNGVNTQGEDIADNSGLKAAYLAYTAWSERSGKSEPRLPGLTSLSPQQMFWVSAAQVWCSKYRVEVMKPLILLDVHSLGEFRVIGPMSNSDDFARDFNCPVGANMNPEEKCQVY